MPYDVHITKAEHWFLSEQNPITENDLEKVSELFDTYKDIPFIYQKGRITLSRADDEVIDIMIEIATRIDAKVQGDEGEFYEQTNKPNLKSVSNVFSISEIDNYESDIIIPHERRLLIESLKVGDDIKHRKYGTGTICDISGEGSGKEFTVTFMNGMGSKRLLAYFVEITV